MKLSTLLLTASLAVTSVFAVPYGHQHQHLHSHEKRQSGYYAITGSSGPVYPRLEIRQMYNNRPNQYTLLLLALERWQAMSQADRLSYYQISGIHGVPRVDWDGVGTCNGCQGQSDGYCTHDSVLFPAWHRIYVTLFEQAFLSIVNDIANNWTGNGADVIRNAASQMRWPYWDWAAKPRPGYNSFPAIIYMKYVSVTDPSGTRIIINPLFRYSFHDNSELVYYPFVNNWDYTFRYPNTNDASAVSSQSSAINAFNNVRPSLQDQVFQMFATCTDYYHFSNDGADSSTSSCSNSLEGIHNTVHTTTGGPGSSSAYGGHMTYLSLAGFDPVFWLHHTNVDRLFAMWQALNPNSWGASQPAPHYTWTITQGQVQDQTSPLTPFHKDTAGNFYNSDDIRDWTRFGYTYPEFSNSDGSANAIKSYVSALYGPSATATAGSSKRDLTPEPVIAASHVVRTASPELGILEDITPEASSVIASLPSGTANPLNTGVISNVTSPVSNLTNPVQANNGSDFKYVANIQTQRYALNGSYQIYLFNGKPSNEEPSTWILDSNLIGPVGILAQPGMTMKNITVAASVPLTRSLTDALGAGLLTDLSEELVVPYLKDNLFWRVAGPDGEAVLSDTIPGFNVSIFGSTTPQVASGDLPTYSDFIPLNDAVKNCTDNNLF